MVYTYDISGRVLSLTYTGYATISTTYDEFDRPNGVTYTFAGEEKSVSFTYGEGGQKGTTVLLSGDTVTTTYDDLSRETSTTISTGLKKDITYTGAGGNKTTTLPESISYSKGLMQLFTESYVYDNIGNIKTVTNNGVTTTYYYDTFNQLIKASSTDGTVTKYFYNDGGNINYKVNADGSRTRYVYDENWKDLLVSFDGQAITYDEIGNPINYLGNTMSWTGRTLDSITKADGTQIAYTYDLNGIRIGKTVNNVTTEYFVNGTTVLAQKTGNDIIWFIYDVDGEILGFTYNDVEYYYIKNIQGDVIAIVNSVGLVMGTYTYDPWGKIISCEGTMAEINPIRYRGYYYDSETGLYYLNSRYYDPDTCRFINADGYITTGQGLLSYNMFAYCLNNPVNYSDSNGCLPTGVLQNIVVGGMAEMAQMTIETKEIVEDKTTNAVIVEDTSKVAKTVIVDQELVEVSNYYFFATCETGVGYNKVFDTGKPINYYMLMEPSIFELSTINFGVDVDINGRGYNSQIGGTSCLAIHWDETSYEVGLNNLGRIYYKNIYETDEGVYVYSKYSINTPEIFVTVAVPIVVPYALPALGYVSYRLAEQM